MQPSTLQAQLKLWPGLEGGRAQLVNLSENHTFRIDRADGGKTMLRVHRPGYQQIEAIKSELNWVAALRHETDLPLVTPIAGENGALIQSLTEPDGLQRYAVAFEFEKGDIAETLPDLTGFFTDLGRIAAICHNHVERWTPPKGFYRPVWDTDAVLNADGPWGDWRKAPHVEGEIASIISRLDAQLRTDFAAYGRDRDRFGLVHADMRLANLMVHEGQTRLIDFDDSGFSWFAYDFGAAVSFFEDGAEVPALKAEWLAGYRAQRDFGKEHEIMLDAAVMLRRMALLAWVGSHYETELAKSHEKDFAANTATLAESYLRNVG